MLLLVALMGLGLVLAAELDSTLARRSKERELLAIGHQFRAAIARYHEGPLEGGQREYPASLDELLRDGRHPGIRRHLRQVFVDPMTGKPEWGLMRVGGRIVGVYSLSELTPIKQDRFDAQDAAFRGRATYRDWVFTYPPDLQLRDPSAPGDPAASSAPPVSAPGSAQWWTITGQP